MEVIKHGNKMRRTTCMKCGCEFIFPKREIIEITTEIPFSGRYCTEKFIRCPECYEKFILERSIT